MTTQELFKNLTDIYTENVAVAEDGTEVKIIPSQSLCTIEISAKIDNAAQAETLLPVINKGQSIVRYTIEDSKLYLKTTIWVDIKPSKTALSEVVNLSLAQFNSVKALIGGVSNG